MALAAAWAVKADDGESAAAVSVAALRMCQNLAATGMWRHWRTTVVPYPCPTHAPRVRTPTLPHIHAAAEEGCTLVCEVRLVPALVHVARLVLAPACSPALQTLVNLSTRGT